MLKNIKYFMSLSAKQFDFYKVLVTLNGSFESEIFHGPCLNICHSRWKNGC